MYVMLGVGIYQLKQRTLIKRFLITTVFFKINEKEKLCNEIVQFLYSTKEKQGSSMLTFFTITWSGKTLLFMKKFMYLEPLIIILQLIFLMWN